MADSLFTVREDGWFLPTEMGRGPWSEHALHGGPVAALVAHAAEAALAESGADARVPVRLTLDLERPVPLAPVRVEAAIVRPGRKVQVAEVTVHDEDGKRLARGSVLAIRRSALDLPSDMPTVDDQQPPPRSDAIGVLTWEPMGADVVAFHKDGTDHRFVAGGMLQPGPATDWIRLSCPVILGVEPSPFQRVVAAADFVNGLSGVLPPDRWTYINPDLTVTVHRLPVGEWVALSATTRIDESGVGTAEADLFDERGRLGRCVQTLLIEPR